MAHADAIVESGPGTDDWSGPPPAEPGADLLAEALETFETHLTELLASDPGRYALIRDRCMAGVFDTEMEAIRQGWKLFGNVPFLVKEIVPVDRTLEFPSFQVQACSD